MCTSSWKLPLDLILRLRSPQVTKRGTILLQPPGLVHLFLRKISATRSSDDLGVGQHENISGGVR